MSEWKPIETAPKDGSWILVYAPKKEFDDQPEIASVCWEPTGYNSAAQWVWGPEGHEHSFRRGFYDPTHWMPLPSPPAP